jgi:hypothetical protein
LAFGRSPFTWDSLFTVEMGYRGKGAVMKDSKPKFVSLRTVKDNEPEMIIDRILGPGLTVIGCELASYRHALMRQMAVAIATGHKFLDTFTVKKSARF